MVDKSELNESGMQCPSFITNHVQVIYTGMRPVEAIVAGQGGNAAHDAHGERETRSVAQRNAGARSGTQERLQAAQSAI
jgi:hypothetical protein